MRGLGFGALVLLAGGCSGATMPGTSSAEQQLVATDGGSCNVPAGVRVSLPSGSGCFAGTPAQICQVSNGATVNVADGAVSGGTETCKPLCGASQYELTCVAAALTAVPPDPDSALGCQGIPIPTPSSSLYYCCPCAD